MCSNENNSGRTGRSSTRPEETRRRDRDDRSLSPLPGYDDIPRDVFNIYKCTICNKGFGGSKFQLDSHNAIYHQNPDQWLYKCRRPGCSRKFPTANKRDVHEGGTGKACVVGKGTKDDPLDLDAPPTRRGGFDDKRATKANETSRHFLGKSKYDWMK